MAASAFRPHRSLQLGAPEEGRESAWLTSGVPEIDASLGGYPRGRITELLGPGSIGKTTLALRAVEAALDVGARRTRPPVTTDASRSVATARPAARRIAGLIDLSRTIFPSAPWATGRLLVVRPRDPEDALRVFDALLSSAAFDLVVIETSGLAGPLPEGVAVRTARLARETGTAVVACGTHSTFGSSCALRLQLSCDSSGILRALVDKSRTGAQGMEIVLERALRPGARPAKDAPPLRVA